MSFFTTRGYRSTILLFSLCSILFNTKIFAQGTWSTITAQPASANAGVMLLLNDGSVICKNSAGGGNGTGWSRLTPVNGSYKNGTWSTIASMAKDRLYFSTQVLPDGRVYVCGGEYGAGGNNGEIWSPKTNTWTTAGGAGWHFAFNISDANSEILPDGTVLQAYVDEPFTDSNWIWHPATNTYTRTGNCVRWNNEAIWVKLPDSSIVFCDNYSTTSERYEFLTGTCINDAIAGQNLFDVAVSEAGAGFMLPNGKAFFIGSPSVTQYYTPSGNTTPGTWANGPAIPNGLGAPDAASAMMPNGHILMALSDTPTASNNFPTPTSYYDFNYVTNTFTQVNAPAGGLTSNNATYISNMLVLPDGTVLFCNQGSKQYYQFTPTAGAPLAAGQPTIGTVTRENCDTFQVTGTLFNGISEGAAYGDDWQMSSNYPIVRLSNATNTYYATTYNWNRIGAVQTGALPDTAIFVTPAGMPPGTYSVTVVANGNPSAPFTINTSLAISPASLSLCVGGTFTLTDAQTIGFWSSANSGTASVGSSTGLVTGVAIGSTTISYSIGQCFSTAIVTVNAAPTATITPLGSTTFCSGSSVTLDANTGVGLTYQWLLGGTIIAGATNSSYVATLGGNYTVVVNSSGGCVDTSAITTVTTTAGPTASITAAGPITFCTGGSVILNANTGVGLTYQWQLGGVSLPGATLSSYTATLGGSYTVIVYSGICNTTSNTIIVTVNTAPTVTPINGSSSVCTGLSTPLTDGTAGGTWSSSNLGIITIGSSSGIATGVATGTAIITYTFTNTCGSISATTVMTVNSSSAVAPINGSLAVCIGNTSPLTDVTASGVWTSSNTGVAGISGSGVVTGASAGTSLISYTVTNGAGCVNAAVATVTVSATFTASITPLTSTTFCFGGNVTLTAPTGAGYTYQWQVGGVNITGATSSSYNTATAGNYTVIINSPTGCSVTTASVTVTVLGGTAITPAVSISASWGDTVCVNATASTFTAIPVNGGTTPTYQWLVNGTSVGTGGTYTYLPTNGDVVSVILTSNAPCAFPDTAISSMTITVAPALTPSVSITSVHNDSTCTGDTVQFAAVPVYGGTAPTYLWTENGINVATGPYYIYVPHNNDTLIVTMTSNYPCLATNVATSNMFIIHVFGQITNTLSVSVSQTNIMAGLVDTFTATATGAGSSPGYQWYINGNPVPGATSRQYITDSLQNGQTVNCEETSSFVCSEPHSIFSGGITIIVQPNGIQQVGTNTGNFTLEPNPNNGSFTIKGMLRSTVDNRVNIMITNVLGQTVYKTEATANNGNVNEQITLANSLAAGTYQVSITSGKDHQVFQIVIEK